MENDVKLHRGDRYAPHPVRQLHPVVALLVLCRCIVLLQSSVIAEVIHDTGHVMRLYGNFSHVEFHMIIVSILYRVTLLDIRLYPLLDGIHVLRHRHPFRFHPYIDVPRHAYHRVRIHQRVPLPFQYAALESVVMKLSGYLHSLGVHLHVVRLHLLSRHQPLHQQRLRWLLFTGHALHAMEHHTHQRLLDGKVI